MIEIQVTKESIPTNKVSIKNNTDTQKMVQLIEDEKLLKIIFLDAHEIKSFLFDNLDIDRLQIKEII
ncbi:hypothetical protein [Enterococcus sp. AZ194]|uniref:hypothetical protein n=1 Tax=Enterococcus sp. AZ194 TaxID=2774629 RepID=UPI003F68876B